MTTPIRPVAEASCATIYLPEETTESPDTYSVTTGACKSFTSEGKGFRQKVSVQEVVEVALDTFKRKESLKVSYGETYGNTHFYIPSSSEEGHPTYYTIRCEKRFDQNFETTLRANNLSFTCKDNYWDGMDLYGTNDAHLSSRTYTLKK